MSRRAWFLATVLATTWSGCDKSAEEACKRASCPFPTVIDLSAGSVNKCGGVDTPIGGAVMCFAMGECQYTCRAPVPCCGGLTFTRDSFSCEQPCESGSAGGAASAGTSGSQGGAGGAGHAGGAGGGGAGSSGGGGAGGAGGGGAGSSGAGPAEIGCSTDSTTGSRPRSGFTNIQTFPTIAGCFANWTNPDLRAARSGNACRSGNCDVAEDACASGWHVCMRNGDPMDILGRLPDPSACGAQEHAGLGFFAAASSAPTMACTAPLICDATARPVGCGNDSEPAMCNLFRAGFSGTSCAMSSGPGEGVLCCKDPAIGG